MYNRQGGWNWDDVCLLGLYCWWTWYFCIIYLGNENLKTFGLNNIYISQVFKFKWCICFKELESGHKSLVGLDVPNACFCWPHSIIFICGMVPIFPPMHKCFSLVVLPVSQWSIYHSSKLWLRRRYWYVANLDIAEKCDHNTAI